VPSSCATSREPPGIERPGHDLFTTARLLRHATVQSTEIYARIDIEWPAEVVGLVPMRLPD
jgi:hypothetical protein